jgi:hypothetical protein
LTSQYTAAKKIAESRRGGVFIDDDKDQREIDSEVAAQNFKLSGKLSVLINFLKEWKEKDPTNKVLIFS